jgi:hypothetical protein
VEKLSKREEEIVRLENEVFKIQNDLQFKNSHKDLLLDTYKDHSKPQTSRKSTDPPHLIFSTHENTDGNDSTDESTKVQSKREFTDIEAQLRDTEFTDKYFDKVYLEICGFGDLKSA